MSGVGETIQAPAKTADESFAESFKAHLEPTGLHVEYGGYIHDGVTTYYALVMEQTEHDRLLEEQNQEVAIIHSRYFMYRRGPKPIFRPLDNLNRETVVSQPSFSYGHATREDALMASLESLISPS